ncbi:MAG: UDP-N-acetylmuramoyl-tripeptide--D-alanyl-D-alanine ligase, partial [Oscillospiraceae bacterium]|nr:UDP-N-acetylmuramoyl-tripeptide--D-alanyl-D-alanine ligase [Oscillospiraceae bacterium]
MLAMTLSEIASILGKEISVDKEVTSVCTDIDEVTEGCVFVALKEQENDGHGFVRRAIENGAVAAITEFQIGNMPCITVDNTHKALFDIARHYRKKFTPKVIGVTGSIGKTTTKEMIALVLSSE